MASNFTIRYQSPAPKGGTEKSYRVLNGKGVSWLAKSMMEDVRLSEDGTTMTFLSNEWFGTIHPWLIRV